MRVGNFPICCIFGYGITGLWLVSFIFFYNFELKVQKQKTK